MKRTGTFVDTMVPLLPVMAAFMSSAVAANVQTDGASAVASLSQIRDTLRNLLRSIDDAGREAENLFSGRQKWCDGAIKSFESANQGGAADLEDMQAQLTEHEAEAEEAAGTVQQVRVDIELVQHTIKQTEDMLKEDVSLMQKDSKANADLLRSLLENKQLSLTSLQGELEIAIPVLAQLKASVAETKQRISYRAQSLTAASDFLSVFKDGCQAGADRADTQAAARMGESNSIHVTLQALDRLEDKHDNSQNSPLSFLQLRDRSQEMTTDDLTDLFSDQRGPGEPAPVVRTMVALDRQDRRILAASSLKPRIQTLLAALKTVGTTSDQLVWCRQQQENSMLALKFARDSVAQLRSEVDAHIASEGELSEELDRLHLTAAALTEVSNKALEFAKKERTLVQSSRKDQQLATKILEQATAILKDLGVANATQAVGGLESAQKMLSAQIKAASGFEKEAAAKAANVARSVAEYERTQAAEKHNLEFARDDHAAQRLRSNENKRLYDADVQEASTYVQKLSDSCKLDTSIEASKQRSAQVHALEDADKAIDGKLNEAKSSMNNLRSAEAKPSNKNLTPMQRAAAEMGVSME